MTTLEAEREEVSPERATPVVAGFEPGARCDYCGAAAKHKAVKGERVLYFCKHDARQYGPGLIARQFEIVPPNWDSYE